MRRLALALAMVASAFLAPIVPACSSTQAAAEDAGGDSAIGPGQFANEPCNPALSNACLPVPCSSVTCDPTLLVCVSTLLPGPCQPNADGSFDFEAGADSGQVVVSDLCASDVDCPTIPSGIEGGAPIVLVCGFSAFDGCNASGQCTTAEPPHTVDGSLETGCGCNGQSVPYVAEGETAAPVQSPTPCSTNVVVVDAGPDAADGGTDASVDAADASDDG